jgi:murein L,D-transpeptidase YcbB/YkuD
MDKDYIDYDGNDNTIESLRDYKKQMELKEFTKEQQTYLISEVVDKFIVKALETLQKESDELDELTAKFNLLLAIGLANDKKEEFKKIETYKKNTIRFFTRNSNDLVKKMSKFIEEVKNDES